MVKRRDFLLDKGFIAAAGLAVSGDGWFDTGKETVVQPARDGGQQPARSAACFQQVLVRLRVQLTDDPVSAVARVPG